MARAANGCRQDNLPGLFQEPLPGVKGRAEGVRGYVPGMPGNLGSLSGTGTSKRIVPVPRFRMDLQCAFRLHRCRTCRRRRFRFIAFPRGGGRISMTAEGRWHLPGSFGTLSGHCHGDLRPVCGPSGLDGQGALARPACETRQLGALPQAARFHRWWSCFAFPVPRCAPSCDRTRRKREGWAAGFILSPDHPKHGRHC